MGPDETQPREPVILGRIAGLYGVRGWVKVHSWTEPRQALLQYKEWLLESGGAFRPVIVAEGRQQGKTLVARFEGTDDRDLAARYVGADVAVYREWMPGTDEGEYYWTDLEGLEVRHRDGRVLGRVSRMMATGAHDVMVVRTAPQCSDGEGEILIPFVPGEYVLKVDLDAGVIDVDWEWT